MSERYLVPRCPYNHPMPIRVEEHEEHKEHDPNGWCFYCSSCRKYWHCEVIEWEG